jgi:hypothetical protein
MRSVRNAFSHLISSKKLDELARVTSLPPLKISWLSCLILQVADDGTEDIRRHIEQAVPICLKHNGVILDMMGSLQFIAWGTHGGSKEENLKNSQRASGELVASLGSNVRIVTLNGNITHGLVGEEVRFGYMALVPRFDRVLAALLSTDYGRITEFNPTESNST